MLKDVPLAAHVARCPGATIQEIVHRGGHDIPSVLESVSRKRGATLSRYQEIRIRHLHHTLEKYCGKDA